MFRGTKAFSGFSVDDLAAAKVFYGQTLGLEVEEASGTLQLKIAGGNSIYVYPKPNHVPATYTILNFPVDDIDKAVDDLTDKGIKFEHYDNMTDEKASLEADHRTWVRTSPGSPTRPATSSRC